MPQHIKLADIDASGRLRPINPDHAIWLASSIEEKGRGKVGEGLEQPIKVRQFGERFKLVVGAHRLSAFGILGWMELEVGRHVLIENMDDLDAELAEIDENLVRQDLNALDRAQFLLGRKELYNKINKVHGYGGDRKSQRYKEEAAPQSLRLGFSNRFTVDVADKVGLNERSIQLYLRIARGIAPEVAQALRGTKIERNQQQLLALCDLTPDEQAAAAKFIASGEAKTVAEARVAIGKDKPVVADPQARLLATLLEAWEKASKVTRAGFLREIGAEIVKNDGKNDGKGDGKRAAKARGA